MGRINVGRVLLGGLLAGVLINISEFVLNGYVIGDAMNNSMKTMGLPPTDTSQIPWFMLIGFLSAITTVWLYAAIRPRFGPGVTTAVYASLAVWLLAYVYPTSFMIVMHMFPRKVMVLSLGWGLVEIVVAGVAGAWAYTEV